MPDFYRHAERMGWNRIEDFYNPEQSFKEVIIISMGKNNSQKKIGTLTIINLTIANYHPRISYWMYTFFGVKCNFYNEVIKYSEEFKVNLIVQRYGGIIMHGMPVIIAAKELNLPSVITVQNSYDEDRLYSSGKTRRILRNLLETSIEKYVLLKATKIWIVSDFLNKYVSIYGNYRDKTTTIYNKTVDDFLYEKEKSEDIEVVNKIFSRIDITEQHNLFLSVGRLIPQKNYGKMIEAFQKYLNSGYDGIYIIIGQGVELEKQLKYIEENNLAKNIFIIEKYLNIRQLGILYRRVNALLFCSLSEGQGRVVYEALAFGTPVIGSNCGPIPEMLVHKKNGYLVNPNSVDEITNGLIDLSINKSNWDSGVCIQSAKKFFIDPINKQESEFYKSILN